MHSSAVWVTRLEAQLPLAALTQNLTLVPSTGGPVSNALAAPGIANSPCPDAQMAAGPRPRSGAMQMAAFALGFASILSRWRRRTRR